MRAARKPVRDLREPAKNLADATPRLTTVANKINKLGNMAAYNPNGAEPPGAANRDEGYLYWLGWLSHVGNSTFQAQDAHGVYRRIYLTASCQTILSTLGATPAQALITGIGPIISSGLCTVMQKSAPSVGKIAVAVGFALSCFAILLFLWVTFGGSVPFKPKSYRISADFEEAITLQKEADVRIGGVTVGKVKDLELPEDANATRAVMEIDPEYAPISSDANATLRQKTLLGETFIELTSGHPVRRQRQPGRQRLDRDRRDRGRVDPRRHGGRRIDAQRRRRRRAAPRGRPPGLEPTSSSRSRSTRSSTPSTRRPARRSSSGCGTRGSRSTAAGRT